MKNVFSYVNHPESVFDIKPNKILIYPREGIRIFSYSFDNDRSWLNFMESDFCKLSCKIKVHSIMLLEIKNMQYKAHTMEEIIYYGIVFDFFISELVIELKKYWPDSSFYVKELYSEEYLYDN